ncbi:cupin domain-containing protein [Amycolatopsis sp. WAC 04197]|uniref:cupin domain-containing protein n=1 Tax=Amycolatopsis sp. WAC 04197 TaxID=2203199 RepID=UPI001F3C9A7A|nr:cupin domain-containing protein [Amycolatopsis sp. WAC 04197]
MTDLQRALTWSGPEALGTGFARGTLPGLEVCSRLLTPSKLLDVIMRRALSFPQLRLVDAGQDVHPGRYLKGLADRRGASVSVPDMRKLGRLLRSGCTLVLDTVDFFDPAMETACRALQWWSRELVQVNAYLTTQQAAGFDLHWDDHDVIIIQLAGCKSWEVRGLSRNAPMFRDAELNTEAPEQVVWSGTMQPGDVIHIPRGYWHAATRTDRDADDPENFSLHATFGFVKRTPVNWLAWLSDRSREREVFRVDLDRWGTTENEAAQDKNLIAEAARLLADHPPSEYLNARAREIDPGRQVSTFGIFGPPEAAVCLAPFPPEIIDHGDTIEVLSTGKRITLSPAALPAARALLSGNPVHLDHAGQALGVDVRRIAEVLIEEEICGEYTPELATGYTGMVPDAL